MEKGTKTVQVGKDSYIYHPWKGEAEASDAQLVIAGGDSAGLIAAVQAAAEGMDPSKILILAPGEELAADMAEMAPYVTRMDFIIGVQAKAPHNCGVVSWDGTMYINMIRNIREPELESHFYRVLHTLGLPVKVESNQRWA